MQIKENDGKWRKCFMIRTDGRERSERETLTKLFVQEHFLVNGIIHQGNE